MASSLFASSPISQREVSIWSFGRDEAGGAVSYRLSQVKDSREAHENAAVAHVCTNSTDVWHESLGWTVPALSLLALLLGVATNFHGKESIQGG